MVAISARCGTLESVSVSSLSRLAAISGSCRVLGAADTDAAVQRLAAAQPNSIHNALIPKDYQQKTPARGKLGHRLSSAKGGRIASAAQQHGILPPDA
jgi:hypothetical protein